MAPRAGFAYLMRAHDGLYKIGWSRNPPARLQTLDVGAHPLALVHQIATNQGPWLEKKLHRRFAHRRVRGEWFALTDDDVARIITVDRYDRPPALRKPKIRRRKGRPPTTPTSEPGRIGYNLSCLRRAAGLTQQELAKRSRLSLSVVTHIEQGKRPDPRVSTVARLARALGVPSDRLIYGNGEAREGD